MSVLRFTRLNGDPLYTGATLIRFIRPTDDTDHRALVIMDPGISETIQEPIDVAVRMWVVGLSRGFAGIIEPASVGG